MKVSVAALVLFVAQLGWSRLVVPLTREDEWFSSFVLLLPVFLALPIVLSFVFSFRRQDWRFDILAPLVMTLFFLIGLGHAREWGGAAIVVLSSIIPLVVRLSPPCRFHAWPWANTYMVVLVLFAIGAVSYHEIDGHLVPTRIVVWILFPFVALFFFGILFSLVPVFLYLFPAYAFAYWKGSDPKRYYDFVLATIAFGVLVFAATPAYELLMRTFVDPCYEKSGAYHESEYKVSSERGLVCFAPKGKGTYGVSAFRSFEGADGATFESFESTYARDKRHVYHDGRVISDDASHFEYLGDAYAKDGHSIYHRGKVLDVDYGTFSKLENYGFAVDSDGLISNGVRVTDDWVFTEKNKGFELRFPKSHDPYRQNDEAPVWKNPIRFSSGECRGIEYDLREGPILGYKVMVFWPSWCDILQKEMNMTAGEIDGVSGERYRTEDGAEETDAVYGNYRYVIRTNGDWHEKMLPEFSFLKNE